MSNNSVYEKITRIDSWPDGTPRSESTVQESREVHEGGMTAYQAFRVHLRELADSDLTGVTRITACHDNGYKISVDKHTDGTSTFTDTVYCTQP